MTIGNYSLHCPHFGVVYILYTVCFHYEITYLSVHEHIFYSFQALPRIIIVICMSWLPCRRHTAVVNGATIFVQTTRILAF
jgi:uncharacterized membrane protein